MEAGQSLLHYRLLEKIGEGGMGVVWKALDTALGRQVALKFLPEAFSRTPDRLARFEREARLLATLNHANVATVHGLHESHGIRFLAMELVEGEDLAQVLSRGRLPVDQALDIAQQVAAALEAAHEHGVIHRDLKPANIKTSPEGKVKVIDFGLAKSFETGSAPSGLSPTLSPTMTAAGTEAGVILGTAAYMAPEQARGRLVDRRADIWALGCVLYEMLAGRRAFLGETTTDLLASVVKEEPRWDLLPDDTPGRVRDLVRRCLVKDPADRQRDAGDARLELIAARSEPATPAAGTGPARPFPGAARLAAALVAGAALASAGWWLAGAIGPPARVARVSRLSFALPEGLRAGGDLRISPDGRVVALSVVEPQGSGSAGPRLLLRRLDDERGRLVPSSEGVGRFDFSADGAWIAFEAPIARESSRRRLYKAPVMSDAPPLVVTDWDPSWAADTRDQIAWMPDGDILAISSTNPQAIVRIDAETGAVRPPVPLAPDATGTYTPESALPDGMLLAHRATWDRGYRVDPVRVDPRTGAVSVLAEDGGRSVLSYTGHLVFSRHDQLLAAPFDPSRGRLLAGPVSILGGLRSDGYSFLAWFDLADDGTLVYLPGGEIGLKRRLVLVEGDQVRDWSRDGLRLPDNTSIDVSADGRWLALTLMNEDGLFEVWGSETSRPSLRRLAGFPTLDCASPSWSPDARRLVFACSGETHVGGVYLLETTAPGEPRLLAPHAPGQPRLTPLDVSPDGAEVLVRRGATSGNEVLSIPLSGGASPEPRRLLAGSGALLDARCSPGGAALAYISNEAGRFEVIVRRRNRDGSLGLPVPVAAGDWIHWARGPGGREDLYVGREGGEVVRYTVDADLKPSGPAPVAFGPPGLRGKVLSSDILPGGAFIAAIQGEDESPPSSISVILGFDAELDRLAGSGP